MFFIDIVALLSTVEIEITDEQIDSINEESCPEMRMRLLGLLLVHILQMVAALSKGMGTLIVPPMIPLVTKTLLGVAWLIAALFAAAPTEESCKKLCITLTVEISVFFGTVLITSILECRRAFTIM